MTLCTKCSEAIPDYIVIEGKRIRTARRSYCLTCKPWGSRSINKRHCKLCNKDLKPSIIMDGVRVSLKNRLYCLDCSPFKNKGVVVIRKNENKTCTKCLKFLPRIDFDLATKNKKNIASVCRSCRRRAATLSKKKCVDYLGGKCVECGYSRCLAALQFHHKDPKIKEFTIGSGRNAKWDLLKKELDKCLLMCSNCHKELHHKEFNHMNICH